VVTEKHFIGPDGAFELAVYPGPGLVTALSYDGKYLPARLTPEDRKKGLDQPVFVGGQTITLHGTHAYRVIDPAEGAEPLQFDLEFLTGRSLRGSVLDPDGKPLPGATGADLSPRQLSVNEAPPRPAAVKAAKDPAEFAVTDLDPRVPHTLVFYHPERRLVGSLTVRGDEKEPLAVKLEPWGVLTGRALAPDGTPLAGADIHLTGVDADGQPAKGPVPLAPSGASLKTDREGRFRAEGLAPGLRFDVAVVVPPKEGAPATHVVHQSRGLSLTAGEVKDLGDLKTVSPQQK
jgi:hypothetical protein